MAIIETRVRCIVNGEWRAPETVHDVTADDADRLVRAGMAVIYEGGADLGAEGGDRTVWIDMGGDALASEEPATP